jgi:tetratricopeptide (TPR) repeat protein
MTITYCGKCGSANGTSARYCRQCGVELSSQSAFSARSTPPNVEFFPKAGTRDSNRDSQKDHTPSAPAQPNSEQIVISAKGSISDDLSPAVMDSGEAPQDPVAISKSLRRVRASGSLIIEAASKKKQDEMNAIIALAIEGFEKQSENPEQIPQAAQSSGSNPAFGDPKKRPPLSLPSIEQLKIPSATQPLVMVMSAIRETWRKAVDLMTTPAHLSDSGNTIAGGGPISPNGPSIVLAQASGLNTKRNLSPKLIAGLIAIALLASVGFYRLVSDRVFSPDQTPNSERELQSAEEQSEKYVQLGKSASERGQYEAALTNFRAALSMTPNKSDVVFLIAKTYLIAGQIEEAMRAYRSVLRVDPENLQARLDVALIHKARGNWNAAYGEFKRIIALDQGSQEANVALSAIEANQAASVQPSPTPSDKKRSRIVARKTPVLPPAAAAQSQMTFLSPEAPITQTIRPPAAMEGDKKEDYPDPRGIADSRKNLGRRFLQVKLYRAAINEFLATLKLTPDDKDLYYFIATAYFGLGQPELAHEYYKRVDRGPYLQVSQTGAKKTEKAWREATKRRAEMMKNDISSEQSNEVRQAPAGGNSFSKALMNIFR